MLVNRRRMLAAIGASTIVPFAVPRSMAQTQSSAETDEYSGTSDNGVVIGEPVGARFGREIFERGGNAIDALVCAAFVAAVHSPHQTGFGGYGSHAVFAVEGGRKIWAMDANSTAPLSMSANTYKLDNKGNVPGRVNEVGWQSAGVPGVLAGLHTALTKFGTMPFSEIIQPAIRLARDGILLKQASVQLLNSSKLINKDPGSIELYHPDGKPLAMGVPFKNPGLARMLEALAQANSIDEFYQGRYAEKIAAASQRTEA